MGGGVTVLIKFFFEFELGWYLHYEKGYLSDEKLVTAVSLFVDKTYDHKLRLTLCSFVEVMYIL